MRTFLLIAGGLVGVWWLVAALGARTCRKIGHQWCGMHAQVEGRVKVACGRCGDIGWMTTAEWQQYYAGLSEKDRKLAKEFGIVPDPPR